MRSPNTTGYTLVELVVAIAIASMFLLTILQLNTVNLRVSVQRIRDASAMTFANEITQSYAASEIPPSEWFECDRRTGSANENDTTINPDASGTLIENNTAVPSEIGLPAGSRYRVRVLAPYGCSGTNAGSPIRIATRVEYGEDSPGSTFIHTVAYGAWL